MEERFHLYTTKKSAEFVQNLNVNKIQERLHTDGTQDGNRGGSEKAHPGISKALLMNAVAAGDRDLGTVRISKFLYWFITHFATFE